MALVAGMALVVALGQKAPPAPSSLNLPPTSYAAELVVGETLGRPDAPVTLEIWSDFQCPFCARLARSYLPRLVSEFVVPGQLRLVARDVAFVGRGDPNESVDAAVAASCAAEQGRYWPYHDMLFWNQISENQGAFGDARLRQMADQIGLDSDAWDRCRSDPSLATAVATTTSAALAAGIDSTPTLVLNGTRTVGMPRTYDDLAAAVRALLVPMPNRP